MIIDRIHGTGPLTRALAEDVLLVPDPWSEVALTELPRVLKIAQKRSLGRGVKAIAAVLGSAERAGVLNIRWDRGTPHRPKPILTFTEAGRDLIEAAWEQQ